MQHRKPLLLLSLLLLLLLLLLAQAPLWRRDRVLSLYPLPPPIASPHIKSKSPFLLYFSTIPGWIRRILDVSHFEEHCHGCLCGLVGQIRTDALTKKGHLCHDIRAFSKRVVVALLARSHRSLLPNPPAHQTIVRDTY